jgi:glycosyltransferase involved in cell wall biosynthesis
MILGIDANEANVTNRVGSNIYAYQIIKNLHDLDKDTGYRIYLKKPPLPDLPKEDKQWHYQTTQNVPLWTRWRLPLELYLKFPRPDLFFTPGHYGPRFSPVPTVISILDLAFLHFPESFQPKVLAQLKSWTKYSIKNAKHIFAISQNTKNDIVKTYQIPPEKITVTHLGANLIIPEKINSDTINRTLSKLQIPPQYLLFIGTRQPRKNLLRLAKAFISISDQFPELHLVITGKTWHQFAQAEELKHPKIIYTGYISDPDLAQVLTGAKALVFPSLYEGFGIPVLEAMNLGTLVIASNNSSIPEITGQYPLLFDPYREKDIAETIIRAMKLKSDQKYSLINHARIRAADFTWEKCARKTMEVLHELALS